MWFVIKARYGPGHYVRFATSADTGKPTYTLVADWRQATKYKTFGGAVRHGIPKICRIERRFMYEQVEVVKKVG